MFKQVLMLVALVSCDVFADGPAPTAAQRLACYEAGYKLIFVQVLKLTQDRTAHRGFSTESYEEALAEATFAAAQQNGLVTQSNIGNSVTVSIAKVDAPEALLGLSEGGEISAHDLQRRFHSSITTQLGAPIPGIYAYVLNEAFRKNLAIQLITLPECWGVYSPTQLRFARGKISPIETN